MRATAYGSHFKTCHVWFEQFDSCEDLNRLKSECKGIDCIIIHANNRLLEANGIYSSRQQSLISDLTQTDDQLLDLMTKTIRNEINRAERENVEIKCYSSAQLKEDDAIIAAFSKMYREMYGQKGMAGIELPVKELGAYIEMQQLLITSAIIDGEPVVFHAYVFGEGNSRFLQSCSEFRVADNATRNAIGRANKYLHFRDFQNLRSKGVERYDWGGIQSLSEPNGIDKFKMAFGAEPIVYYNVTMPMTFKYRIYDKMISLSHGKGEGSNG